MWECIRAYKPVHIAALLYILENLKSNKRESPIELENLHISEDKYSTTTTTTTTTKTRDIVLTHRQNHINIYRVKHVPYNLFNVNSQQQRRRRRRQRIITFNGTEFHESMKFNNVLDLIDILKDEKALAQMSIEDNKNHDNKNNNILDYDEIKLTTFEYLNKLLTRIVLFNCTTPDWQQFLHFLIFQLFPDNLQFARYDNVSNVSNKSSSKVNSFLRYYKMMSIPESFNTTSSMDLKYMIIPKLRSIDKTEVLRRSNEHITQPYYQGFFLIVNCSDTSVRFYNRWSEYLQLNKTIQKAIQNATDDINCTLVAILLPKDHNGNLRSWRYWPYRKSFEVKVVDIIRFKSKSLVTLPLVERLKYLRSLRSNEFISIVDCDKRIEDYELEYYDASTIDCFTAMIGVVLKHPRSLISTNPHLSLTTTTNDDDNAAAASVVDDETTMFMHKFPLKNSFDLSTNSMISVVNKPPHEMHLFFNPELAQYYTTVVIYNHDDRWLYACRYNVNIHQFQHYARFERQLYDNKNENIRYSSSEKIMVVDSPFRVTRGVLYLRVYYNDNHEYLGYDKKFTTSRYDVPMSWDFDEWFI